MRRWQREETERLKRESGRHWEIRWRWVNREYKTTLWLREDDEVPRGWTERRGSSFSTQRMQQFVTFCPGSALSLITSTSRPPRLPALVAMCSSPPANQHTMFRLPIIIEVEMDGLCSDLWRGGTPNKGRKAERAALPQLAAAQILTDKGPARPHLAKLAALTAPLTRIMDALYTSNFCWLVDMRLRKVHWWWYNDGLLKKSNDHLSPLWTTINVFYH